MAKKTVDDVNVEGRRVLLRGDFNVPIEHGRITDDRRISQALDSIHSVLNRRGKLILMSHLGRPKDRPDPALSLRPVALHLAELLGRPVAFAADCVGPEANAAVSGLRPGDVLLLENLRFHSEETLVDKAKVNPDQQPTLEQRRRIDAFAESLAAHADLYCNDAFGTCHRNHVSMYDVPLLLGPGRRVCGHLVQRELRYLGEALARPERPFIAILGGAKVTDKIGVIESLLPKVDAILIGGAMAYTFLAAQGRKIGGSLFEEAKLDLAAALLRRAADKLHLPTDSVCAAALTPGAETALATGDIASGLKGLDIGPATVADYSAVIRGARTIVWNGPMGVFETPPFDRGTMAVARALAEATHAGATTIIGGGDSAAAAEAAGVADQVSHISTGGGASLEFLEGKEFATIRLLDDA